MVLQSCNFSKHFCLFQLHDKIKLDSYNSAIGLAVLGYVNACLGDIFLREGWWLLQYFSMETKHELTGIMRILEFSPFVVVE